MKKTFKQWAKQDKDLDEFLSPGDYIDERLYTYIEENIVHQKNPCYNIGVKLIVIQL